MHKCYSNGAYMHGYCSACILYFTNFFSLLHLTLFFSLDPFTLTSLLPPPITIALDRRRRCNHQPSNTQPPPHGKPTQLKSTQTHRKTHPKPNIATFNITLPILLPMLLLPPNLLPIGWVGLGFAFESKLRGR